MARPQGRFVVLPPDAIERDYRRALIRRERALGAMLRAEVERLAEALADDIDGRARQDALRDTTARFVAAIEQVRLRWARTRSKAEVLELARKTGHDLAKFNARRIERWFKQAVGVDPVLDDTALKFPLSAFERANLSLITNMDERLIEQTQNEIIKALREGRRANELAGIVQERLGVAESRAKLIARDQLGSLNGQLTKVRQQQLGVTRFIWQTSEDERVRPEHEDLNGEVFTWAQGAPGSGIPGEPINCRCVALPILEDVIGPEPIGG